MKPKMKAQRGLHLVTPEEAAACRESTPNKEDDVDKLIGQAVRRYEQVRAELDRELFADNKDLHKLSELMPEMQQLREALARYGVHIR